MKDIFAPIYEKFIYKPDFDLIFQTLFDDGGYVYLGLIWVLIPLIFFLLFYYVWRFPYGRWWHWLLWLGVTVIFVFGATWGIAKLEIFASSNQSLKEALDASESGYKSYAQTLPRNYAIMNSILAVVITIIYSFFMKQFSKIQTHLPL